MSAPSLPAPGTPLTSQERRILAGIARGRSNLQIAADLHLSVHTVKTHLRRMAARLDCPGSRAHVVATGYRTGALAHLKVEPRIHQPLDARHLAVLAGLADGLSNADIGHRLGLAQTTVTNYTKSLFVALGADNREHAIALGYQHGHLMLTSQPATTGAAA